jgi:YcaO-like protein with predicted kinase domain
VTEGAHAVEGTRGTLMTLQRQIGVTRLADITGLDCVRIPVVQAVRPFSKSNAVSQGKGATLQQAALSALMESAEGFFAERTERYSTTVASAARLELPVGLYNLHVDPDALAQWHHWDIAWVPANNLLDGSATLVPLELVHTAYVVPPPDYDGVFSTSTTGLAVSTTHSHAVRHGLFECIERDALARANGRHGFFHDNRIDPLILQSPELDALLSAMRDRGFLVGLWLAPAAGDIPVVWCHLMEDCHADQAIMPNPAEGSAARLSVVTAAIAAIHEAAQSRLTVISGARDDVGQESYRNLHDRARRDAHWRLLKEGRAVMRPPELARVRGRDADSDVTWVLSQLQRDGITTVCEVQLDTEPIAGLYAVKIVVPELQPLLDG